MTVLTDLAALRERLGDEVAVSDWLEVTQARIEQFADATDDRQWIHVDPARAAAQSPFGATVAHGFLTLSLLSTLARRAMTMPEVHMGINYGLNRVRFLSPVTAGSRIRARFRPVAVAEIGGTVQVTWAVTVEREGGDRPCCVAEWIVRYYPRRSDKTAEASSA
jgi:acyl dehydratase